MKRTAILISLVLTALLLAPAAGHAAPKTYTVLLAGGSDANRIRVWLSPDGRNYVIDSIVPLEVGGSVCSNPEGNPNELLCQAPLIAGFEVNAGANDDLVAVGGSVSVPVTMRGGSGDDRLVGGSGPDKLIGGSGDDTLVGGRAGDLLLGGPGRDKLRGGWGADVLIGGPHEDALVGGPGRDSPHQFRRARRPGTHQAAGTRRR